jgi:D-proline reductase (dithiol) PrdB
MGGLKDRLFAKLLTAFPSLAARAADKARAEERITFSDSPWTPVVKSLSEMTFSVVTTSGVHLKTQAPFDMADPDGDPTLRELPSGASSSELTITHDYYDHSDALKDFNIVYPAALMREAAGEGAIGGVTPTNYGLMGHITGRHVDTLVNKTAPEIVKRLKAEGAGAVLLTPG